MNHRWEIRVPDPALREVLASSLHLHPVTAQLLMHRGVKTTSEGKAFLSHDLSSCPDPFMLKDMEKAVFRLQKALQKKEKILVWGDYDVDGITSTAILVRTLRRFGFDVLHHIPHRLRDGYGLNKTFLTEARKKGVHVIISVDTGIAGHDSVDHLKRLGMDIILTDHHTPKEVLPEAYAIINPLQKGCAYPFRLLSGAGLSYKLATALADALFHEHEMLREYLDLVAVGTVADVVPMIGENRTYVYHGLRQLEKGKSSGLRALLRLGRVKDREIVPRDISFIISPRINAAGRLGSSETALELLLADREDEARRCAFLLETGNRQRRVIERAMVKEALQKVESEVNFKEDHVIVLQDEKWHPGVVGIVASRILHRFYRPTIVIAVSGKVGRGSARSIQGFSLPDALDQCKEHLDEFGGHPFACGLTLQKEAIPSFRESLNKVAGKMLEKEDLIPTLSVDMELSMDQLTPTLLEELVQLAPFGTGNPEPLFLTRGLHLKRRCSKGGEVWMDVGLTREETLSAWEVVIPSKRAKEIAPFLEEPLDLIYHPVLKAEGRGRVVLRVKDFFPTKSPSLT